VYAFVLQDGQAVVESMLQLLDTDKSKDVRIAVVQSLPLHAASLPVLLERTRDVNPLVRKALVLRLKGLPIKLLRYDAPTAALCFVESYTYAFYSIVLQVWLFGRFNMLQKQFRPHVYCILENKCKSACLQCQPLFPTAVTHQQQQS
jgi:hypothetical protein